MGGGGSGGCYLLESSLGCCARILRLGVETSPCACAWCRVWLGVRDRVGCYAVPAAPGDCAWVLRLRLGGGVRVGASYSPLVGSRVPSACGAAHVPSHFPCCLHRVGCLVYALCGWCAGRMRRIRRVGDRVPSRSPCCMPRVGDGVPSRSPHAPPSRPWHARVGAHTQALDHYKKEVGSEEGSSLIAKAYMSVGQCYETLGQLPEAVSHIKVCA